MNLEEARKIARDLLWVRKCNYKYEIADREPLYCGMVKDACKYRTHENELPECTYFSELEKAVDVMKNKGGRL